MRFMRLINIVQIKLGKMKLIFKSPLVRAVFNIGIIKFLKLYNIYRCQQNSKGV